MGRGGGRSVGGERINPVILSGGAGTRLWPLSRALYPKQLMPLVGERTMLQETVARVADREVFEAPLVICQSATGKPEASNTLTLVHLWAGPNT